MSPRLLLLFLLAVPVLAHALPADSKRQRLNVLFIVVDDLRTSLGSYGDTQAQSPNLDRLAKRGVLFERAYCQYPVCNPSRSSFLTGWRPDTTGILENETALRQKHPDVVTLPQFFRQNGYFSAGLGKIFHSGINPAGKPVLFQDPLSFEAFNNFEATKTGRKGTGRNMTGGALKWCSWLMAEGGDEDQTDGRNAAEAIRLMETRRPFFLGVGFHKPHDPFNAPKKYFDLYPLEDIQLCGEPEGRSPELPHAIPNPKAFAGFTDQDRKEFHRAYLACFTFTDAQIGKLLDTLDRLALWDTTIVVAMGDNGYHLGEHGWWNKDTTFEQSARVPLIVWAPGLKGMGRSTHGIVELLDLYPTLAELTGIQPPHTLEGTSFVPLLEDPSRPGKPAAFTQVARRKAMGRSIRTDRWRYTEWDEGRAGVELYDHSKDSSEYFNLAAEPANAALVKELADKLHAATSGN